MDLFELYLSFSDIPFSCISRQIIAGDKKNTKELLCSVLSQTARDRWTMDLDTMKTILLFLFLFSSTSSSVAQERSVCGDFVEGACDLSEHNIIDYDRHTETPEECQVMVFSFRNEHLTSFSGDLQGESAVFLVHSFLHPVLHPCSVWQERTVSYFQYPNH